MAKVIGPLHSDHVKGSMSGLQFSEYRGMAVCKRKLRPVLRATTVQASNRAIVGWLSTAWGLEDPADRAMWDIWAQNHPKPNGFGGNFQLDGNQAYMMLNHTAVRLGGEVAKQSQPPVADVSPRIDTLTATGGGAVGEIDLVWTVFGTGLAADFCEVLCTGAFESAGRRAVLTKLKFNQSVAGNVATAKVTGLQPGKWHWLAVRYVSADGQTTVPQYIQYQSSI